MPFRIYLIFLEVVFITILDYTMASQYYTLDVLYCLPVIQAASTEALSSFRRSDSKWHAAIAIFCALTWSIAEAAVVWPDYPVTAFLLNAFTRAVTFTVIARVIAKIIKEKGKAQIDATTGLINRAEFVKRFEAKQMHSERTGKPYSLLSIIINRANAQGGQPSHEIRENEIVELANLLREHTRGIDIVSRIGGEEFMLLLPETDDQSCELLRIRITTAAEKLSEQNAGNLVLWSGHATETGKNKSIDELMSAAKQQTHLLKAGKIHTTVASAAL